MLALFFVLFNVLGALYWLWCYASNSDYRKKMSKIKRVPGLPLLGHVFKMGGSKSELLPAFKKMWIETGRDKFLLKIGMMEHVIITNPKDVEVILSSNQLLNKNILYKNVKDLIGDGLITVEGAKWRPIRKALTPAFHFKVLESYVDAFQEEKDSVIKELSEQSCLERDVDVYSFFYPKVFTALCRAGIGLNINKTEYFDQYVKNNLEVVALTNEKIFSSWKYIDFIYKLTAEGKSFHRTLRWLREKNKNLLIERQEKLKDVIEEVNSGRQSLETITKIENYFDRRISFIDLLLLGRKENGEALTYDEMLSEIQTFTVAGHETTTTSTSFALYNLATHADIQEAAYQEQLSITNGDLEKPITFKALQEMKYLDCVVKESMRKYSAAVFFGRSISENTVLTDGIELPAGSNILLMPFLTHNDSKVFPNPEKFDPNRFIENPPSRFMYFPFSAGPRDCVGKKVGMLQVKFWLATILRFFELMPPIGEHPKLMIELVLKSSTGVNMRLRKRSKVL